MNDRPTGDEERLVANIARVRSRIEEAAGKVGRSAGEITLVAVSKTVPVELVEIAYNLGVTDFGENRVQDALPKIAEFHPRGVRWHMIGHLQSNKASRVVGPFACIHSADSVHLVRTLNRHAGEQDKELPILLQVNISGEERKEGMSPGETPEVARQVLALPHLEVQGLMTIAPLVRNPEEVRGVFRSLRELRDHLREILPEATWHHLSMGMTDDY